MYWVAALASLADPTLKGCWDERTLAIVLDLVSENFILSERRVKRATHFYILSAVLNLCQVSVKVKPQRHI